MLPQHFKAGINSIINLGSTNPSAIERINLRCGDNCTIQIGGIEVINTQLTIYMNDNATLLMGNKQKMNGRVDIYMHEPSTVSIGEGCLFAACDTWTSDMHNIYDATTGQRIN